MAINRLLLTAFVLAGVLALVSPTASTEEDTTSCAATISMMIPHQVAERGEQSSQWSVYAEVGDETIQADRMSAGEWDIEGGYEKMIDGSTSVSIGLLVTEQDVKNDSGVNDGTMELDCKDSIHTEVMNVRVKVYERDHDDGGWGCLETTFIGTTKPQAVEDLESTSGQPITVHDGDGC